MTELSWNASDYRRDAAFVYESSEDLISWLEPRSGEAILDLGCGTGELTARIASHGAQVVGVDSSASMLELARRDYPALTFELASGESLEYEARFDAIFSNAALHWMTRADDVASGAKKALRPGGRFVMEFGESRNIAVALDSLDKAMDEVLGRRFDRGRWYFPTIGEHASRLERSGFRVVSAHAFERPSFVADRDGASGLELWYRLFAEDVLESLGDSRSEVIAQAERHALSLRREGGHALDYVRLRMKAIV